MDEVTIQDYVNLLMRRKRAIAVVMAISVVAAVIALLLMPKTYEGEATLLFPQQAESGLSSELAQLTGLVLPGGVPSLSGRDVYVTVLKSRTISENVCRRLHLDQYELDYKDLQARLFLEAPKEGGLILTCEAPTSWLRRHVPGAELKERTADLAARIANSYVAELAAFDRSNALFMGRKNRRFIERQLDRTKTELAAAEARLQKFQESYPTLAPPDESAGYSEQALRIAEKQLEAGVALRETEGQLTRARSTWDKGAPGDISPEALADSMVIGDLRAQLAELEVRRATLLEGLTENHPQVVSLSQEIEKTSERLRSEVDRAVRGQASSTSPAHQELLKQLVVLEVARDGLDARKSGLAGAMSSIEERLSNLPAKELEYARLIRDVKAAEMVYNTLLAEHAKARITEGREADNFVVLDRAVPPDEPAKPRVKLTLAAALVFGCFLGVFVALVQESLSGAHPERRKRRTST